MDDTLDGIRPGDPDVIVVGAGIAGLSAALTASAAGQRVLVVDAHGTGGRARTTEHNGYAHNVGPHALYRGGHLRGLLERHGIAVTGGRPETARVRLLRDGTLTALTMRASAIMRTTLLADSLTTTFLVMLERLSPEERLVVLLVDVFGESFHSVAALVDRTDESCRQLAVRARRKLATLRDQADRPRPSQAEQLAVASAFVGAVLSGDVDAVKAMLTDDSVLTSDGGARRHAARRPVVGPERIARFLVNLNKRMPAEVVFDPVWVNGAPGVVVSHRGRPFMVSEVEVVEGKVHHQYWVVNPDKLARVGREVELV